MPKRSDLHKYQKTAFAYRVREPRKVESFHLFHLWPEVAR
jgi:hypothetical protein